MEQHFNDWDLQAVVRSCGSSAAAAGAPRSSSLRPTPPPPAPRWGGDEEELVGGRGPEGRGAAAASLFYELEYLDLERGLARPPSFSLASPPPSAEERPLEREVLISFPAASTSGMQQRPQPGRRPGIRTPRPKRSKKRQLKKVVHEVPVADGGVSTDLWAWRKYGQKPIKGSPYPRGYYKCSSLKACMARKMVERSPAKPGVLIITYMADHCHPVPAQLNSLAGTTRHKSAPPDPAAPSSPDKAGNAAADEAATKRDDSTETSTMAGETADDEDGLWPVGFEQLLGSMDGDDHHFFQGDGVLGRRLSL